MKLTLVHDWLDAWGGAENVLVELRSMFPDAPVFTLVDFLEPSVRERLGPAPIYTSALARLPHARAHFRKYLPWFPSAIRHFDLSDYDVILSNSHAVAKFAKRSGNQLHLCYCHTPMRYAWDLREQYLDRAGIARGVIGTMARGVLSRLRAQDLRANRHVDRFIANSDHIAERIRRCYGRDSDVIYPPVDTDYFQPGNEVDDYYLTVSRLVPYKHVEAIVAAFAQLRDRKLLVVGTGPGLDSLRANAPANVQVEGQLPAGRLLERMQGARAFVFAAEEDFGIAPLEAQACGVPVIALARGGVHETVGGHPGREATGTFFPEATADAIAKAIVAFEHGPVIPRQACRANALRFGRRRFRDEFHAYVQAQSARHDHATENKAHPHASGMAG